MRIGVVGVGAMGSVYAGLLADAGHDVSAVDTWEPHVSAIRRDGLRVQGASGDRTVRLHASTNASDVGPVDLLVIATKARDAEAAAKSATSMIGPETLVLTIQNGLGAAERVGSVVGRQRLLLGVVGGFGAEIRKPGHVFHNGWELLHLGELGGEITERLQRVVDAWRQADFPVQAYDDIERMVWEKFICNVCYSGTATVSGSTIGEIIEDPHLWKIASGCAVEAFETARAKGIAVAIDEPVSFVREFGSKIPDATPSMALDLAAGRPSEIDVINGAVPLEASRVGLSAPYNEVVSALVRHLESGFHS